MDQFDIEDIELLQILSLENEPDCQVLCSLVRNPAILNDTFVVGEALFFAVDKCFLNSLRILLEAGASANTIIERNGKTALHIASGKKQGTQMMRELLKHGADVNAQDEEKRTPLLEAAFHQCVENAQELLQNGAMVNATNIYGNSPLIQVMYILPDISLVQLLLSAGADVNHSDGLGRVPLYYAARYHSFQFVRLFLQHKAYANVSDSFGTTLLHCAAWNEKESRESIRELVKCGANLNLLDEKGHSALYCAVDGHNQEATQELLRCGASFDIVKCLESLVGFGYELEPTLNIARELIRYVFIRNAHSLESIYQLLMREKVGYILRKISCPVNILENFRQACFSEVEALSKSIHQQLLQEKVGNIIRNISGPENILENFRQACFSEVEALSKLSCDCGTCSIWGSINDCEYCRCDTHEAILKFLLSWRQTNFNDIFFRKLDENFLMEMTLNLISYFAFKESKKRLILPWPCMKEIKRYVSFEDAVSFLQSKQPEMGASEFEKFRAFMKGESSAKSSSEISLPVPKRPRVS